MANVWARRLAKIAGYKKVPFPLTRLTHLAPRPVTEPVPELDLSTPARQGAYLPEMAHCRDCHTPLNPKFQPGMEMAGGNPQTRSRDSVDDVAPNSSPDPE